mmetsp:Transcript_3115/g.7524  ORF Transcript_3115/g.7524 Transcript_3115/m.7524 type:complete len:215 (+) Transcript_3115:337-981(+)
MHIRRLRPPIIHPGTHPDPDLPRRPAQPRHPRPLQRLAALPGHLPTRLPILEVGPVPVRVFGGHQQGRPGGLGLAHPRHGQGEVLCGVAPREELGACRGPGGAERDMAVEPAGPEHLLLPAPHHLENRQHRNHLPPPHRAPQPHHVLHPAHRLHLLTQQPLRIPSMHPRPRLVPRKQHVPHPRQPLGDQLVAPVQLHGVLLLIPLPLGELADGG